MLFEFVFLRILYYEISLILIQISSDCSLAYIDKAGFDDHRCSECKDTSKCCSPNSQTCAKQGEPIEISSTQTSPQEDTEVGSDDPTSGASSYPAAAAIAKLLFPLLTLMI